MQSPQFYTKSEIDKLGNAIIFLCEKLKPASKTHLLKLIFILEEQSVQRFGIPFFNLRFDLWKLGPVSKDLFVELSSEPELLEEYIAKDNNSSSILPKRQFCDDEFSDRELELLNEVTERFRFCTSGELVNFTHRKGTPWHETAVKHGVLEELESGKKPTTDIEINLRDTIEDDKIKLGLYDDYKEYVSASKSLMH